MFILIDLSEIKEKYYIYIVRNPYPFAMLQGHPLKKEEILRFVKNIESHKK